MVMVVGMIFGMAAWFQARLGWGFGFDGSVGDAVFL